MQNLGTGWVVGQILYLDLLMIVGDTVDMLTRPIRSYHHERIAKFACEASAKSVYVVLCLTNNIVSLRHSPLRKVRYAPWVGSAQTHRTSVVTRHIVTP